MLLQARAIFVLGKRFKQMAVSSHDRTDRKRRALKLANTLCGTVSCSWTLNDGQVLIKYKNHSHGELFCEFLCAVCRLERLPIVFFFRGLETWRPLIENCQMAGTLHQQNGISEERQSDISPTSGEIARFIPGCMCT